METPALSSIILESPLGPLRAIATPTELQALEFVDSRPSLRLSSEKTLPLQMIEEEIALYFEGKLKHFKAPLHLSGTPFQLKVWEALQKIPYGKKLSYAAIAQRVGRAKAYRAVGSANGANKLVLIVPCHRVINSDGGLGGYSCGLNRKEWLLRHEGRSA